MALSVVISVEAFSFLVNVSLATPELKTVKELKSILIMTSAKWVVERSEKRG